MGRCAEKHRRNERERQRVYQVNEMFNRLRHSVRLTADKKLSKADTLRSAIQYIEHLKKMLENGKIEISEFHFTPSSSASPSPSFPSSLTSPKYSNHSLDSRFMKAK
ncbi:hypothetical protein PRIPAC_87120 [Pristionchus pacificus]|nr:hypothetical protein PRIPAC_87120 [Pristionchus pacificus]